MGETNFLGGIKKHEAAPIRLDWVVCLMEDGLHPAGKGAGIN